MLLEIGTWLIRTEGDPAHVLAADRTLVAFAQHWFVRETVGLLRRTFARLDVSSRTLFALIEGFVKFEDKGRKGKFISVYAEQPAAPAVETA